MIAPISKKIDCIDDLKKLQQDVAVSSGNKILVCAGGGCLASGSDKVILALRDAVAHQKADVDIIAVGCMGLCVEGPVIQMMQDRTFYQRVQPEDVTEIIKEHALGGNVIERLVARDSKGEVAVPCIDDIDFFNKQTKIVLRNCGQIDPESIDAALSSGVYQALGKVLSSMDADAVIEEMKGSGLRGRGGAGFPTWMKWNFTRQTEADQTNQTRQTDHWMKL